MIKEKKSELKKVVFGYFLEFEKPKAVGDILKFQDEDYVIILIDSYKIINDYIDVTYLVQPLHMTSIYSSIKVKPNLEGFIRESYAVPVGSKEGFKHLAPGSLLFFNQSAYYGRIIEILDISFDAKNNKVVFRLLIMPIIPYSAKQINEINRDVKRKKFKLIENNKED